MHSAMYTTDAASPKLLLMLELVPPLAPMLASPVPPNEVTESYIVKSAGDLERWAENSFEKVARVSMRHSDSNTSP